MTCPTSKLSGTRRGRLRWLPAVAAAVMAVAMLMLPVQGMAAASPAAQGNVLRATLANGLKVVIVRNTLAPVATTIVNYKVGSNEAPEGFPGTAHAQEHMMFRGSPGLSASQLADIIAGMGGDMNADTQQTVTQYFFNVPAQDLDVALHVQAIRMSGVLDDEKLWDQERGAIEQEVAQDLSNPQYVFYTKLLKAMFAGTPYEHDALGTKASFDKTTGKMLKKFWDTWYAPNNAILVVVGDVDPAATLQTIKKLFGPIPAKKIPPRPEVNLKPVKPAELHLTTDLPYGLAIVSFRMPGYDSPDYAASLVLADVLSSKRGSLYALVPKGKALYAGFQASALPKAGLGFSIAVFPKGADTKALVGQVKQILAADAAKGLPADLVLAAKRRELTDAEDQKNSVMGLAMEWSQALAVEGKHSPQDDIDAIEKVTVADVNRVAKKYLDLDHAIVAVLTPQPSGKPISSKGFGGHESFTPKNPKPVELPAWAKAELAKVFVPKTSIHPVVTTLPNGLKLIVQPEEVSSTVKLFGHVKNNPDLEAAHGKEGVDQVLDRLFSFGTTTLDRVAFQKALDDIGASASAGTDFQATALADHFDRAVQLLADNELHPALPPQAFMIEKMMVARSLAGVLQSPDYLFQRAIDKALYPKGDPVLRQATPKTVGALTLGDVKAYYAKVFRPDLTTVVVIGKITPERAKAIVAKYFGSWKAEGAKPPTELPKVPLNAPSIHAVPDSSRVQDNVMLAETLGLVRSNPDYYALEVGNRILGGGFYASRLYRDLREKAGLVYYVVPRFDVRQTRARYTIRYGCYPKNVSKARAMIVRNLKKMQEAPVTATELAKAKALLLRQIPLSEASVGAIARGLLDRVDRGLPLDEPVLAAQRYLKMTPQAIQKAFATWVRPNAFVQVTQGPAPK